MTLRKIVQQMNSAVPAIEIKTMPGLVDDSLHTDRFIARLAGVFGLLAMVLASIGLYGIMAYTVARRTRDIGIRMALGAQPGGVLWLVLRETTACCRGSSRRITSGVRRDTFAEEHVVRLRPGGSRCDCRFRNVAGGGGRVGWIPAGAAGHACGSDGSAAVRVARRKNGNIYAGHALRNPDVGKKSGIYDHRRAHSGSRDRRKHRDFLGGERGIAAPAAVPQFREARECGDRQFARALLEWLRLLSRHHGLALAESGFRKNGRLYRSDFYPDRPGKSGAFGRRE